MFSLALDNYIFNLSSMTSEIFIAIFKSEFLTLVSFLVSQLLKLQEFFVTLKHPIKRTKYISIYLD